MFWLGLVFCCIPASESIDSNLISFTHTYLVHVRLDNCMCGSAVTRLTLILERNQNINPFITYRHPNPSENASPKAQENARNALPISKPKKLMSTQKKVSHTSQSDHLPTSLPTTSSSNLSSLTHFPLETPTSPQPENTLRYRYTPSSSSSQTA